MQLSVLYSSRIKGSLGRKDDNEFLSKDQPPVESTSARHRRRSAACRLQVEAPEELRVGTAHYTNVGRVAHACHGRGSL